MSSQDKINQEPIFIVGFPRSGTTFLQSLLSTQSDFVSFPETHFFNKGVGHFTHDHLLSDNELGETVSVLQHKIDVLFDKNGLNQQNSKGFDQKSVFESWLVQLAEQRKIDLYDPGQRWVEKTPAHGMFLSKILNFYPNAKVIAMVRNPLFAIDSYYRKLIDYRKPYHDLADEWRAMYSSIEVTSKNFKNQILIVKYEDLVQNQDDEMRKIGQFIDCEINLELLSNFNEEAKKLIAANEPWKESNTRASNYKGADRHHIPLKNVLQIEYLLRPYFKEFNYPIAHSNMLAVYSKYRDLRS